MFGELIDHPERIEKTMAEMSTAWRKASQKK